ncbi:MAG: CCA tRNA nucleotidyltransferase [Spirochaetales bacterium]|nr:CCA tRNA nucleotidyltransferase [Spirochaetales bacterium]
MKLKIPASLRKTAHTLLGHGYAAFLVGGAVRDQLLDRTVQDFDIATDARPETIMKLFKRVVPTGLKHGTVTVLCRDHQYEITTFRTESTYTDFRHPDEVQWSGSIDEDLRRRDFTINAIACNLDTGQLYDPFDGQSDIKCKIIRAIGNPLERFQEDPLRTIRACRFSAQLDFSIEQATQNAMKKTAPLIQHISEERIRDEFVKIMGSPLPSSGIKKLEESGLLTFILPELDACRGIGQGEMHSFDVYTHSLYSSDFPPKDAVGVRIAALFHDIGKADTMVVGEHEEIRFYGHEKKSREYTNNILSRLKFPNKEIHHITHLVLNHMFHYEPSWSDAAVRRFIHRVGQENIQDLILLRRADQYGMNRQSMDSPLLNEFQMRIDSLLEQQHVLSLKDLAVDGSDIMEYLNIPASPQIGLILHELMETVLDDPSLNTRQKLLGIAKEFYKNRLSVS